MTAFFIVKVKRRIVSFFILTLLLTSSCEYFGTQDDNAFDFVCQIEQPSRIPVYDREKGKDGGMCRNQHYINHLHHLWKSRKPLYYQWISASKTVPYHLYNIQGETNNLFKYAKHCNDTFLFDELLNLYITAINTLDKTNIYHFFYYPNSQAKKSQQELNKKHVMWLTEKEPTESILASSQYLALIAEAVNAISVLEDHQRTSLMRRFISDYIPVLKDHYKRWIFSSIGPFQVKGWGCKVNKKPVKTGLNHQQFLQLKHKRLLGDADSPSYCNAVTDSDLWILSGVSHLMAASRNHYSNRVFLDEDDYARFDKYLTQGLKLLASRMSYHDLNDFQGKTVQGAIFDAGVWRDLRGYRYAGLNEHAEKDIQKILSVKSPPLNKNVGWDLSHSRRFVHVFTSLYDNKESLKTSFPSQELMTQLSNQLLYGVFNQDFKKPLFSNYMDGSNGWYRVNYAGKKGFGYRPWDMSLTVLTGGYGFWSPYNTDINTLYHAIMTMLNTDAPEIKQHVKKHYEQNVWINYQRNNKMNFTCKNKGRYESVLIQFLPSLYNYAKPKTF